MPLYYTAASSSRIKNSGIRKRNPVSAAKRRKVGQGIRTTNASTPDHNDDVVDRESGLEKHSVILSRIAPGLAETSVVSILRYVPGNMFDDIPDRASGMNSVRIAEILNYRFRLPPIVSSSHVHALKTAPTTTEREIASLVQNGTVCKIFIPGRGTGISAVGNGLVLILEWERSLSSHTEIDSKLKEKYLTKLQGNSAPPFRPEELRILMKTGFLTGSSMGSRTETLFTPNSQSMTTLRSVAKAGSTFASGSEGAVASGAVENISGGSGAASRMQERSSSFAPTHSFSLPNMGIYLRLLTSSRDHLVSLITKSGPNQTTTLDWLKERWDGGVVKSNIEGSDRRGVLPGKTKRWKELYGLRFEWVLAECLGAGLIECFRTGSVGTGVRII